MPDNTPTPGEHELLPPSEDGIFKSLMTRPESKPILRDVIGSVLEIPVTDVTVMNTELPISDISEKRERLDVSCVTSNGEQIDVEMQSNAMAGDSADSGHRGIKTRAVYYLCDLHAKQEGGGISYKKLMKSYQITICGYQVFSQREDFINRFSFRNSDGDELTDTVGIVFVELSKMTSKLTKPTEELTPAEMWGLFFRYADSPQHSALLERIKTMRSEIKMATEILQSISRDADERARYRMRRKFEMDEAHTKAELRREGSKEGSGKVIKLLRQGYTLDQVERMIQEDKL